MHQNNVKLKGHEGLNLTSYHETRDKSSFTEKSTSKTPDGKQNADPKKYGRQGSSANANESNGDKTDLILVYAETTLVS